jgi:hypothetical protein
VWHTIPRRANIPSTPRWKIEITRKEVLYTKEGLLLNQLLAKCEPVLIVLLPHWKGRKRGNHYESTEASEIIFENIHSRSVMILIMLFNYGVLWMSEFWRNIILLSA